MSDGNKKSETRIQNGFLSRVESRVLKWIAARLPQSIGPDHLTLLGLISMAGAGVAYALSGTSTSFLHVVNFCLFLNWFGDSLDGTLARYRQKLRPRYGFYVDHLIDSFGAVFLLVGLGFSGLMSERVAFSLLAAYLLLSIHSYLATHTLGVFRISFFYFGPTELRLLLALGNLVVLFKPVVSVAGYLFLLFDVGGAVGILVITVVLLIATTQTTRTLYDLERV